MDDIIKSIEDKSKIIEGIADKLVHQYCNVLDEYMEQIGLILNDIQNPPTDAELEDMALNLPNLLYFVGEGVESIGIREDVAKALKQDLYNEIRLNTTGTVGDKQARAEMESVEESLIHCAYQRAYKKMKLKLEAGFEMLNSVKKVISRRMLELQLSFESQGGKIRE